jgi:hypothetical protein
MAVAVANRNWEEVFTSWSAGPSTSENQKCENAERAVRKAIAASEALSGRDVQVFVQGSYRNNTNSRFESDVDVCVRLMDGFFYEFTDNITREEANFPDGTYPYSQFKNDVEAALRSHLGKNAVTRGNKAFDVHENTYRIDADVVPAFEHRRYVRGAHGIYYLSGTEIRPDSGGLIQNWPHQNYENGVAKNDRTGRRFKRVVRILKRLRNEMAEKDIAAAKTTPSYLIECLVWNVADGHLNQSSYKSAVRDSLASLFNNTIKDDTCHEWGEVNELKYLFRPGQPWTRQSAHAFVSAAWDYVGLK